MGKRKRRKKNDRKRQSYSTEARKTTGFYDDPVLILIFLMGAATCLFRLGMADLDMDESWTALIAVRNLGQILDSVKPNHAAPSYFFLLWVWEKLFGASPVALRMLSVTIGLVAVVVTYVATRRMFSLPAARWSAFLMVISPLWLFRARDARMYQLVVLLSVLSVWAMYRAISVNRPLNWMMVTLVFVLGCYTHNYGLLLLPVILFPFFWPRFNDRRVSSLLTLAVAIVLWLPWLPVILEQTTGVGAGIEWIARFWEATPPALAIPKSLVAFMPGGFYPTIMRPMPHESTFFLLIAVGVYGGAFYCALRPRSADTQGSSGNTMSVPCLRLLVAAFLLCPLLMAWGYSLIVRPIYLVGRYDIIALPAFCMIAGWGIERCTMMGNGKWYHLRCGLVSVLLVVLWFSTLVPYYLGLEGPLFSYSNRSAQFLAGRLNPGDALVYLGSRRSKLEYALRRVQVVPAVQMSFPDELDMHPGWKSSKDMMRRFNTIRDEGRHLRDVLYRHAKGGNRVWIAVEGKDPISESFVETINERFRVMPSLSSYELNLFCLTVMKS